MQQVVVAIGHAQPILAQIEHILARVLGILLHTRCIRRGDADPVEMSNQPGDCLFILERVDLGQLCFQRLQTQAFQGRFVHETGIQVRDPLLVRILGGGLLRVGLDVDQHDRST